MSEIDWRPQVLRETGMKIAENVGLFVEAGAKHACPIGKTGNLNRSITMSPGDTVTVGTNVHYAAYVEFGTVNMRAQPYLVPALTAARSKYGGRIG